MVLPSKKEKREMRRDASDLLLTATPLVGEITHLPGRRRALVVIGKDPLPVTMIAPLLETEIDGSAGQVKEESDTAPVKGEGFAKKVDERRDNDPGVPPKDSA